MEINQPSREELLAKNKDLEERLCEAEQTIQAIRSGEIDALVVYEPAGEQLYTLKGADYGYRVLVESINEGALIVSPENSIYYCNHRFAEMLQVPIQQITGTTIRSYVTPEAHSEVGRLILESRSCGKSEGEFTIRRNDGTLLPVKLSLNCVSLEDFHGVCGVMTDLSEQKKNERELRITAEKLQQSNEELQDFAFIASHDLQEPLRKIQAFGDRLSRRCQGKLDETENDYLTRMQSSAKRMQTLIHGLLKYSRLFSQCEPVEAVNLRDPLMEAISDLELKIERSEADLQIADLPTIEVDKTQIRQLFQNLIANSLKFRREEKPRIKIYTRKNKKECRIFVEDNGIGFDETYLDRIFVPFQRLHGRGEYEGTGMGLAICRKIVERHGGSITAKSAPGACSTFIITLPSKVKN